MKINIQKIQFDEFSLLYQTLVFSAQVEPSDIVLNGVYFNIGDAIEVNIHLINEIGGFTEID